MSVTHSNSPHKFQFIDTLRGLAILGVILVHTGQWIEPTTPLLHQIAENGAQGVQLFFITSALTLFLSYKSRQNKENSPVRNFFLRRFFRIAPMYYLAIGVFFLIDGLSRRNWAPNGLFWWDPLTAFAFLNGWSPDTINSVVPGGWSVVDEMTFYLLVPWLFSRVKDIKTSILFIGGSLMLGWLLNLVATLLLTPLYPKNQQYLISGFTFFWFFSQLPVFGIGILIFHLFERFRFVKDRVFGLVLIAGAAFLSLAFLTTNTYEDLLPHHVLMAFGFAMLVLGLYFSNPRLIVNSVTQWIGKISFSLYLVHFAVLRLAWVIFPKGFPLTGDFGMIAGYVLIAAVSMAISFVTYRLIEQPGIELGRTIIDRLEAKHQGYAQVFPK